MKVVRGLAFTLVAVLVGLAENRPSGAQEGPWATAEAVRARPPRGTSNSALQAMLRA